jgi:hypothetical protein
MVLGQVRAEIEAQLPQRHDDIAALEAELASVRTEQKRLAKAVALSDDIPELVVELHQRSARIQNLEAQLIAARRTPAELAALVDRVETNVRANVASLREALAEQSDLREVFQAMFPRGLTFEPARTSDGARQIWEISGDVDFATLLGSKRSDRGFECVATPTGFEWVTETSSVREDLLVSDGDPGSGPDAGGPSRTQLVASLATRLAEAVLADDDERARVLAEELRVLAAAPVAAPLRRAR